ncbi:MAG: hypothetical protein Q9207_005491 [Kuettlingeria erythrocarpa]
MVNPGKPSGGCELCRQRRIKCDEVRPTCSYCRKKQVPCCFPKSQFDIAWRDQNQVASNAVRRRLNVRDKGSPDAKRSSTELLKRDTCHVPTTFSQDHEGYALAFFFSTYLLPSTLSNHQRGFLGCVYPVWTRAGPLSPLRPAVNAVAQALLEAWSFLNPNLSQSLARRHYAQAIVAVRRQLQNAEDVDDDLLLAMLMLDLYDGIRSFCAGRPHESPHVRGSAAAMENRRRLPVNSKTSQGTLLGVRSRIVGNALYKGEPVSKHVLTWTTSAQSSPRTPEIELEAINIEVANLQVRASGLKTESLRISVSASELLAIAIKLDERLTAWTTSIPDDWVPHCIWGSESIPPSVREAGLYQDHCTIYQTIWVADTFNGHCCSRIKIGLVILACLEHTDSSLADMSRVKALTTIQDLADSVCASIPYHLGDRVEAGRIDDRCVQYPRIKGHATPDEHYVTAAAYAGMFLLKKLVELLQLGSLLRTGQCQWIVGQIARIKKIYLASPA